MKWHFDHICTVHVMQGPTFTVIEWLVNPQDCACHRNKKPCDCTPWVCKATGSSFYAPRQMTAASTRLRSTNAALAAAAGLACRAAGAAGRGGEGGAQRSAT